MHVACHLKQCITDFGPVRSFWLFSFERYNGILENIPTNNRSLEIQLMRRFICDFQCGAIPLPEDFSDHFLSHIQGCRPEYVGSLLETMSLSSSPLSVHSWTFDENMYILPKRCTRHAFDDDIFASVKDLYQMLHPTLSDSTCAAIPLCYLRYNSVRCIDRRNYQCSVRNNKVLYMARWVFGSPENSDGFQGRTAPCRDHIYY